MWRAVCWLCLTTWPLARACQTLANDHEALVEAQCGRHWQAAYRALHKAVLDGTEEPRYTVFRPAALNGLADDLTGLVSAFWFSFVTKRALVVDKKDIPFLADAYSAPNVDWHFSPPGLDNLSALHVGGEQKYCQHHGDAPVQHPFLTQNLSQVGEGAAVVHMDDCFRGNTLPLFHNPLYRDHFARYGLRPETGFGCALHYLLAVQPEVRQLFSEDYARMARPDIQTIAIHIRTYQDESMAHPSEEMPTHERAVEVLSPYSGYFECAQALSERYRSQGVDTQWLFLADDIVLRRAAAVVHGNMTFPRDFEGDRRPQHIQSWYGGGGRQAMLNAAGELWLLSLAQAGHVFGKGGFGRTGFLASLRWNPRHLHEGSCEVASVNSLAKGRGSGV